MNDQTTESETYTYAGVVIAGMDRAAIVRKAEKEAAGKTADELIDAAEVERYMAERHYLRTEGRELQAARKMLRAETFDRIARETESLSRPTAEESQ